MQVRRAGRIGFSFSLLLAAGSGCAALGTATKGVTDTTSAVQSTTGALDSAKGTVDSNMDKAKAENDKARGGKGGSVGVDGDNARSAAKESKVNEPITDNIDPAKKDPVDWKVFEVSGRPGIATAQLNWDDPEADLAVDVYNAYGEQLAASPPRGPSTAKKVLVQIPGPDKYYLRIQSIKGASDYTCSLRWANGSGNSNVAITAPPPQQVPPPGPNGGQVPNPVGPGPAGPPAGPGVPPVGAPVVAALPDPADPNHPRCKIVQSFRGEDGKLILYIDKGSSVGIKSGMTGSILDGKEQKKLDGGDIRITKVIDGTHSQGTTPLGKVGKNNNCIIDLVKP